VTGRSLVDIDDGGTLTASGTRSCVAVSPRARSSF
jgi:hypothetical protein